MLKGLKEVWEKPKNKRSPLPYRTLQHTFIIYIQQLVIQIIIALSMIRILGNLFLNFCNCSLNPAVRSNYGSMNNFSISLLNSIYPCIWTSLYVESKFYSEF